jgi:DNA-binding response OmpR family regulator
MENRSAPQKRQYRILIIEDDAAINRVLQLELEHEGYEVDVARDGLSGLEKALKEPDLVVLDLMLPRMDGIEVCKRIRAKSRVPIIMLTARDRVPDRVAGLDVGADDYVTKPFSTDELLARVRARLRERSPQGNVVEYRDVVMDRDRHEVHRAGKAIALTAKEYALLEYLLLHRNKVHTRDELFNGV